MYCRFKITPVAVGSLSGIGTECEAEQKATFAAAERAVAVSGGSALWGLYAYLMQEIGGIRPEEHIADFSTFEDALRCLANLSPDGVKITQIEDVHLFEPIDHEAIAWLARELGLTKRYSGNSADFASWPVERAAEFVKRYPRLAETSTSWYENWRPRIEAFAAEVLQRDTASWVTLASL